MDAWVVWLLLAAGLLVAEVFTLTFVLGLVGLAAVLGAVVALAGGPVAAQIVAFAVAGAALGFGVAPVARRSRRSPDAVRTGVAALEGRTGLVTHDITTTSGRVKVGGESWGARPLDPSRTIPAGTAVSIARVDGASLIVYEQELP